MAARVGMLAEAAEHYAARRLWEARHCCEAALAADPSDADARHLLGVLLLDLGDVDAAITTLEGAVARLPGHAQALYHLGNALRAAARDAEAAERFRAALELAPEHADARNNLGNALLAMERPQEAAACYEIVLAARAEFAPARFNLGNAKLALDQPKEAERHYRIALNSQAALRDPRRYAEIWQHLGAALMSQARHADALDSFDAALSHDPANLLAAWNKALGLLSLGQFDEGWVLYERRWDLPGFAPPEVGAQPTPGARAIATMRGRRVLLRYEQGYGDTLQFVRYAPLLASEGVCVHLFVQRGLKSLLNSVPGVASVCAPGDDLASVDAIWPLLSLPHVFATRLATIPATVPYLAAPPDSVAAWRVRLGPASATMRIGLAWSGAHGHSHDRFRSVPAEKFAALLRVPGCTFHLMQTEVRDADRAWMADGAAAVDHSAVLADYSDTAAAVLLMDLVISVDTSLAHLAGALGRPVWIMLAFSAEWRWLVDRTDSPWYPTARLFRQPQPGDWDSVLADVEAALRARLQRPTA